MKIALVIFITPALGRLCAVITPYGVIPCRGARC